VCVEGKGNEREYRYYGKKRERRKGKGCESILFLREEMRRGGGNLFVCCGTVDMISPLIISCIM